MFRVRFVDPRAQLIEAQGSRSSLLPRIAAICRSTRANLPSTRRRSNAESSPSALHFRQVRPRQQPVLISPLVLMADLLGASASSLLDYGHNDCCQTAVISCGGWSDPCRCGNRGRRWVRQQEA